MVVVSHSVWCLCMLMGKSCWRPGDVLSIQRYSEHPSMCRADPQRASSGRCPAKMAWRSRNATVSGHGLLKPQRIVAGDMPRIPTSREKASLHMPMICQLCGTLDGCPTPCDCLRNDCHPPGGHPLSVHETKELLWRMHYELLWLQPHQCGGRCSK